MITEKGSQRFVLAFKQFKKQLEQIGWSYNFFVPEI
jgi:hypothetical protein